MCWENTLFVVQLKLKVQIDVFVNGFWKMPGLVIIRGIFSLLYVEGNELAVKQRGQRKIRTISGEAINDHD